VGPALCRLSQEIQKKEMYIQRLGAYVVYTEGMCVVACSCFLLEHVIRGQGKQPILRVHLKIPLKQVQHMVSDNQPLNDLHTHTHARARLIHQHTLKQYKHTHTPDSLTPSQQL